jgi:hypothetical protein
MLLFRHARPEVTCFCSDSFCKSPIPTSYGEAQTGKSRRKESIVWSSWALGVDFQEFVRASQLIAPGLRYIRRATAVSARENRSEVLRSRTANAQTKKLLKLWSESIDAGSSPFSELRLLLARAGISPRLFAILVFATARLGVQNIFELILFWGDLPRYLGKIQGNNSRAHAHLPSQIMAFQGFWICAPCCF